MGCNKVHHMTDMNTNLENPDPGRQIQAQRYARLRRRLIPLSLGLGLAWALHGGHVYTKTATQVTVRDELFGTESVEWRPGLRVGLDVVIPAGIVLLAVGVFGQVKTRRNRSA